MPVQTAGAAVEEDVMNINNESAAVVDEHRTPTKPASRSSNKSSSVIEDGEEGPLTPRPPSMGRRKASASGSGGSIHSPGGSTTRIKSRSSSAAMIRVNTAQQVDSEIWHEMSAIIAEMEPLDDHVSDLCAKCDQLQTLLQAHPLRVNARKGTVLRSLFRLLDLTDCRLRVKVVRNVLILTNQMQTLNNVCKLLFAETRYEQNDNIMRQEGISEILVHILRAIDIWCDGGASALMYCCGAIKNISATSEAQVEFATAGAIAAFATLVKVRHDCYYALCVLLYCLLIHVYSIARMHISVSAAQ